MQIEKKKRIDIIVHMNTQQKTVKTHKKMN